MILVLIKTKVFKNTFTQFKKICMHIAYSVVVFFLYSIRLSSFIIDLLGPLSYDIWIILF